MNLEGKYCYRNRIGEKTFVKDVFLPGTIQACNTLQGQEHTTSSSKNFSAHRRMSIANIDRDKLKPKQDHCKGCLRNKIISKKPKNRISACSFHLQIFFPAKDERWYLEWDNFRTKHIDPPYHTNHYPIHQSHLSIDNRDQLSQECHKFIRNALTNGIMVETIINQVYTQFKINIKPSVLNNMKTEILDELCFKTIPQIIVQQLRN